MTFAIIHHNTLIAIGLRHLLHTYFDAEAHCFASPSAFNVAQPEQYDAYFVTPTCFVAGMELFLPRKSRVVILDDFSMKQVCDMPTLDMTLPLEELLERVNAILSALSGNGANETAQEDLTQREVEVLRCVASGMMNKEIADELHISINTVLSHRKNIVAKLGIKTVSGLSLYAMMNGIIAPGK